MSDVKKCVVCADSLSKYKCPACFEFYCSVSCCKQHRGSEDCLKKQQQNLAEKVLIQNDNSSVAPQVQKKEEDNEDDVDSKLTLQQLAMLDESEELKSLLTKDADLRRILGNISSMGNHRQADRAIREQMNSNPAFLQFVDTCLEVVEPKNLSDVVSKFSKQ